MAAIRIIVDGDTTNNKDVPLNHIFDSHFVIATLIKKHSDVYLRFAASFNDPQLTTSIMHGQIALHIAEFCNKVNFERVKIEGVEVQSYSINIHDSPSPCACWIRRHSPSN